MKITKRQLRKMINEEDDLLVYSDSDNAREQDEMRQRWRTIRDDNMHDSDPHSRATGLYADVSLVEELGEKIHEFIEHVHDAAEEDGLSYLEAREMAGLALTSVISNEAMSQGMSRLHRLLLGMKKF